MGLPPKCPRCKNLCQSFENMIPAHIVFGCRPCRAFRLEKHSQWLIGVGYVLARLAEMAKESERDDEIHDEILNSDITDPRWINMSIEW